MGNCMVQQKKVMIKVVTTDEETVEHNKPSTIKVHAIPDDPAKKTAGEDAGVLRIKVVISKQELQAILDRGGVTVEDIMASKLQNLTAKNTYSIDRGLRCSVQKKKIRPAGAGWVPDLESIPEGNL